MDIANQSQAIQSALQTWADTYGGKAFVASDEGHMWKMAYATSQIPRIIICYNGESLRGDFSVAAAMGRVDRHWKVAITRGRGFNANRGDSLNTMAQNAQPMWAFVDQMRDVIRSIMGISVELPVDYTGITPMNLGELILDGYMVEFSTATDLPAILANPDDPGSRIK